jgi:hypothetical protein
VILKRLCKYFSISVDGVPQFVTGLDVMLSFSWHSTCESPTRERATIARGVDVYQNMEPVWAPSNTILKWALESKCSANVV